jgi:hypothetical protein
VASTGEILNVPDPYSDPRFNKQADKDNGYLTKSILCVPVRDGDGRTIAVLQAINKLNGATFSSDDQMVLEKLTMLAGISLRNAQLFEDSELQKNKVQSLLDVIRTMSSNMGLNSIIFTITQRFPGMSLSRLDLIEAHLPLLGRVASLRPSWSIGRPVATACSKNVLIFSLALSVCFSYCGGLCVLGVLD